MSEGPEHDLAAALIRGLRTDFVGRDAAALQFAELILDATQPALDLASGGPAAKALAEIELCAMQVDVYSWDGAPGWDEVLLHGLAPANGESTAPDPLHGLGSPPSREGQRALCEERATEAARSFLAAAKQAAAHSDAGVLRTVHASLLRLTALSAIHPLMALPEDREAGALPPAAGDVLVREMDERAAAGSDIASAQQEWLARLEANNPAAKSPAFGPFFAGLSQSLRLAVALRAFRDGARSQSLAGDLEPLVGTTGAWQPVRWKEMRAGVPASWVADLFPARQQHAGLAALAAQCDAALDVAGRLWTARSLSASGFSALACALFARSACALAVRDEM